MLQSMEVCFIDQVAQDRCSGAFEAGSSVFYRGEGQVMGSCRKAIDPDQFFRLGMEEI